MRNIDADALIKKFMNVCRTEFEIKNKCMTDENVIALIHNAPTVEYPEQITVECDTEEEKQKLLSALRNARITGVVEEKRPQVDITEEQAIDKLHETGWLPRHDKKMTERPQGEWDYEKVAFYGVCSNCGVAVTSNKAEMFLYEEMREFPHNINFCPNCGAKMTKEVENE